MKNVLLIGNNGHGKEIYDGQRIKTRCFIDIFKMTSYDITFIEIDGFIKNPIKHLIDIAAGFRRCDAAVLITQINGTSLLLPFLNFLNPKGRGRKSIILPLVGSGILDKTLNKLDEKDRTAFIKDLKFKGMKPSKFLVKQLKKVDYILPETNSLCRCYERYFGLHNIRLLVNFRKERILEHKRHADKFKIVFLSRVLREKGIYDLIDVVIELSQTLPISLDIYGPLWMSDKDKLIFYDLVSNNRSINYCGTIKPAESTSTINKYDAFCLPTRFFCEGIPGATVEAMFAGVPVISSKYPQSSDLLNDDNSILYPMFDNEALKEAILKLYNDKRLYNKLEKGVKKSAETYSFDENVKKLTDLIGY